MKFREVKLNTLKDKIEAVEVAKEDLAATEAKIKAREKKAEKEKKAQKVKVVKK